MSIPRRIWRILMGRLNNLATTVTTDPREQALLREAELLARAKAEAARELAETTGRAATNDPGVGVPTRPPTTVRRPTIDDRRLGTRLPPPVTQGPASSAGQGDPLAGCYRLLQFAPGSDLAALEVAYQARLAQADPARYPEGSQERFVAESRRQAIVDAYEKLRDALHPTETRFEKLEF